MDVVIVNGVRLEEPITIAEVMERFGRDALISIERPVRELPPVNGVRCVEPTGDVIVTTKS